jgi:hypothetical protein
MSGLRLIAAAAVLCCALAASCATKNINYTFPPWGPIVTVTKPAEMSGGAEATWTVSWPVGQTGPVFPPDPSAPYTISMNMGGGTTQNIPVRTPATIPFAQTFTMVNPSTAVPATYTYTVVVTNSQGLSGTATGSYTVGPSPNHPPVIEDAVYSAATRTMVVTVSDPDDGETLTVDVTVLPGCSVDSASKVAASKAASATGPLTASFVWSPSGAQSGDGSSGNSTVTVTDSAGATASTDVYVVCEVPVIPAGDALLAFAAPTTASVGEPVTVMVVTTAPAHPLQFINGIGMTVEEDASFVPGSINIGVSGGAADSVDGFWDIMNPSGFMLQADNLMVPTPIEGGRERWDFNITPLGGSDIIDANGALFNVQFTFSTPGMKHFGFEQLDGLGVKRTYYSDGAGNEYFWSSISNEQVSSISVQ